MDPTALLTLLAWWVWWADAVRINYVRVPTAVRNNSGRAVVLDCDYTVRAEDRDAGLVVKWFLNGAPAAVYQWIPPQRPQGLGPLRGRLDLEYRATEDSHTAHRALKILNPTTDIGGEYKCFVSTFNDEDFSARHMTVFEPERQLVLKQSAADRGLVNVSCHAAAVFPEPELQLYKEVDGTKEPLQEVETWSQTSPGGRYDVTATARVSEDVLPLAGAFHCELSIPRTGYTRRVTRLYHPLGSRGQKVWTPAVFLIPGIALSGGYFIRNMLLL